MVAMNSISNQLLRQVLSIYLTVTAAIFALEMIQQYSTFRSEIGDELQMLHTTYEQGVSHSLWNMDEAQIRATVTGMLNMPSVTRVVVRQTNGDVITDVASKEPDKQPGIMPVTTFFTRDNISFLHEFDNSQVPVGSLEIQSNSRIIFNKLIQRILISLASAAVKTLVLIVLVKYYFERILSRPLVEIARRAGAIDPKQAHIPPLPVDVARRNELDVISKAINGLAREIEATIGALDALNQGLETQVANRTRELRDANAALDRERQELGQEVQLRRLREDELHHANDDLAESLRQLRMTQAQLIEYEKMVALGGLVAGIAHEINTPVGLGMTGATHFQYMVGELEKKFRAGELEEPEFEKFLRDSKELARSIEVSLNKASNLVKSFKQVAVDQNNDVPRSFAVCAYLQDILLTHHPVLRKTRLQVRLDCPEHLEVDSYPGAWSQIISNLIANSLTHGYPEGTEGGLIDLQVREIGEQIELVYRDNGKGMGREVAAKVFEPFFTTNRQGGGSGLGMHIVYNVVTQQLQGTIRLRSEPGQGVEFTMTMPKVLRPSSAG